MREFFKYFPLFVLITILQVYVMDQVVISSMVRPVIYFYIILILPEIPLWILLLLGFGTGIIFDSFDHTPGVNMAACTLLAYFRKGILRFLKPGEQNDNIKPHLKFMGWRSFLNYIIITSLFFHLVTSFLAAFTFSGFFYTMERVLVNSMASVLFIFILDVLFFFRGSKTD